MAQRTTIDKHMTGEPRPSSDSNKAARSNPHFHFTHKEIIS